jgi:hypothetical protein
MASSVKRVWCHLLQPRGDKDIPPATSLLGSPSLPSPASSSHGNQAAACQATKLTEPGSESRQEVALRQPAGHAEKRPWQPPVLRAALKLACFRRVFSLLASRLIPGCKT